jgi:hypothetical protein
MKILILVTLMFLVASCGSGSGGVPPPPTERKFLFGIRLDSTGEQDFIAVTSNPQVASKVAMELEKPISERVLMINGAIDRGNNGNMNWSWHFKANDWDLVATSIELCDGLPSFVEQDIHYWVDVVQRFCPWASFPKQEIATQ